MAMDFIGNVSIYKQKYEEVDRELLINTKGGELIKAARVEQTSIGPTVALYLPNGTCIYKNWADSEAHYVGEQMDVNKIGIIERRKPGAEPSFRIHYPADAAWVNAGPKGVKVGYAIPSAVTETVDPETGEVTTEASAEATEASAEATEASAE